MHYLLTGLDPIKNPFVFESPRQMVKISPRTDSAIMKALELKAENRPGSMQEMLSLLPRGVVGSTAGSANSITRTGPVEKKTERSSTEKIDVNNVMRLANQSEIQTTPLIMPESNNTSPINRDRNESKETRPESAPKSIPTTPNSKQKPVSQANAGKNTNTIVAACLILVLIFCGAYAIKSNNVDRGTIAIDNSSQESQGNVSNNIQGKATGIYKESGIAKSAETEENAGIETSKTDSSNGQDNSATTSSAGVLDKVQETILRSYANDGTPEYIVQGKRGFLKQVDVNVFGWGVEDGHWEQLPEIIVLEGNIIFGQPRVQGTKVIFPVLDEGTTYSRSVIRGGSYNCPEGVLSSDNFCINISQ